MVSIPIVCAAAVLGFTLWRSTTRRWQLPLPPSCAHNQASVRSEGGPWLLYTRLSKVLGPLFCLPGLGQHTIVLSSFSEAIELMETRSNFSCRPTWPMAELVGRQRNIGFLYYGERLRKLRREMHLSLGPNVVKRNWARLVEDQTVALCRSLFSSPEQLQAIVEENVQRHIARFVYGRDPSDEFLALSKQVLHQTGMALQPGRWMVNFYPHLKWIPAWVPGASFQRFAHEAKTLFMTFTRKPYIEAKSDMEKGTAQYSFVQESLSRMLLKPTAEQDETITLDSAASFFGAGVDTTVSFILTAIALVSRNKDVQDHAYEELISVVGHNRLPNLEDREKLTYIECLIQEVHRLHPAVPLLSHSNIEEDECMGFRIPKKSWLLVNLWAMLHDETIYPNPEEFTPERFLPTESGPVQPDPRRLSFGLGRRRCAGVYFADMTTYLMITRLLFLFEFSPELDEHSVPKPLKFTNKLVTAPEELHCVVRPRPHAKGLLAAMGL